MKNLYFCNIIFCSTNSDITKSFHITSNSMEDLGKKIIKKAFDFSSKNSFYMPFDYISDDMNPYFDDENCQETYFIFLDSNCFSEDNFDIYWDNHMKQYGRMRWS